MSSVSELVYPRYTPIFYGFSENCIRTKATKPRTAFKGNPKKPNIISDLNGYELATNESASAKFLTIKSSSYAGKQLRFRSEGVL